MLNNSSQILQSSTKKESSPSKLRLRQLTDKLSTMQFGQNEEQQAFFNIFIILDSKRSL